MGKKKMVTLIVIIDIVFFIVLGCVMLIYNNLENVVKLFKIMFSILVGIGVVASIVDIVYVIRRKKRYGKSIIKLELFHKHSILMVSSVLIIVSTLNLTNRNFYIMMLSILSISIGLLFEVRGIYMPSGILETGVFTFGEIIRWEYIENYKINTEEKYLLLSITQKNIKKDVKFSLIEVDINKIKTFFETKNIKYNTN